MTQLNIPPNLRVAPSLTPYGPDTKVGLWRRGRNQTLWEHADDMPVTRAVRRAADFGDVEYAIVPKGTGSFDTIEDLLRRPEAQQYVPQVGDRVRISDDPPPNPQDGDEWLKPHPDMDNRDYDVLGVTYEAFWGRSVKTGHLHTFLLSGMYHWVKVEVPPPFPHLFMGVYCDSLSLGRYLTKEEALRAVSHEGLIGVLELHFDGTTTMHEVEP